MVVSEWTDTPLPLAVPAALRDKANLAAAVFDPNSRGDLTFPEPNVPEGNPTHSMCRTQLVLEFVPMLQRPRQPEVWFGVLSQMAAERGRELGLTYEDVVELCNEFLFDDECDFLTETIE
jgi:hypothetical protein